MPSSKINKERIKYFIQIVQPLLRADKVFITELNSGSYRLSKGLITLDYYPSSGKYHHINSGARGQLTTGEFEELINKII